MGIPIIFVLFNLIAIRSKSYVVAVDADRWRIKTQQNVAIDGRSVADGRSLAHVGAYAGFTTNGN